MCFTLPLPTQKSNTMTQMDCSHITPQRKVYKALLNISNSCGTNTPEIKALQEQSKCFTSVASKSHSPDACFQQCLHHSCAWPSNATCTGERGRDTFDWKDNHADSKLAGARRKSHLQTLVSAVQRKANKYKVTTSFFLCILHSVQSMCAGMKKLLVGG